MRFIDEALPGRELKTSEYVSGIHAADLVKCVLQPRSDTLCWRQPYIGAGVNITSSRTRVVRVHR